ncbi:indole-3-glycerol phosphate synthase TrpC [Ferruginibacter yonginensis]|uniref:indole-3-glycerol-phosphate synthase n=1 Tax=Ferruginibacter yonginensis TaxID=1310416 RepID=A0ABV8QND9_9BACT
MTILDTIIQHKYIEVAKRKLHTPIEQLQQSLLYQQPRLSLIKALQQPQATGIIAEFKRKSPSKGFINQNADAATVTTGYAAAGASALSVLTDELFFGGTTADLLAARVNQIPILRKDFIVDAYQIEEAKAMGADVILLIAACLTPIEVKNLAQYAKQIGLEVLLELHDETELQHVCEDTVLVGINNRNLKTFEVDIAAAINMSQLIGADKIKIAESGISEKATLQRFKAAGYKGFLIGENFMKTNDPAAALQSFINN